MNSYKLNVYDRNYLLEYDNGNAWNFNIRDLPEELERIKPKEIEVSFQIFDDNPEALKAKLYKRLKALCKKAGYELWNEDGNYLMLRNL